MDRPTNLPPRCGETKTTRYAHYTCVGLPSHEPGKHMFVQLDDHGHPAKVIH